MRRTLCGERNIMARSFQNDRHNGEQCSLMDAINSKVRPLMDAIDLIRSLGLKSVQYSLPKIAVIGDQSVGKSSCLEALSGIQLPRGDAQKKITGDDTSLGARGDYITLELESPDLPDLTLIDLPGIVRFSEENHTIEQEITAMITRYIEPENTIILVVFPANTDFETVGALALASKVDPSKERTMGVITKVDLINPGSEKSIINTMNKEFGLGIYAVRNRNQDDLNQDISLQDAMEKEEDFFQNHKDFRSMDQSKFGVGYLADKLAKELTRTIRETLPEITNSVKNEVTEKKQERDKLGRGISEVVDERKRELIQNLSEYTETMMRLSKGEYTGDEPVELRMLTRWREATEEFADEIQDKTKIGVKDVSGNKDEILKQIQNNRGFELPGFINGYRVAKNKIQKLISTYIQVASRYTETVCVLVEDTLRDLASTKFKLYPKLAVEVKNIVDARCRKACEYIEQDIKKLFIQESYVWTLDRTFEKELEIIIEYESAEEEIDSSSDKTTFVRDRINRILAYMKVAERRITDTIPMTVIYHSLGVLPEEIKRYVLAIAAYSTERVDDLFEENTDIAEKRKLLDDYLQKLREAELSLAAL